MEEEVEVDITVLLVEVSVADEIPLLICPEGREVTTICSPLVIGIEFKLSSSEHVMGLGG